MGSNVLLYTQVGTIFTFIVGLFVLYRLLVQNKDSIIELLENRIEHLNEKMASQGADTLSENLSRRISLLSLEIERLNTDKDTNTALIKDKEKELNHAKGMYECLQDMIMHTSGMSVSYFCPVCDEPTIEYAEAKVQFQDRSKDSFLVRYRCGYTLQNGKVVSTCSSN